ncbi:uncharacterized protein [Cicer arietinum]|uniref:Uncharacterized protein LOC101507889 n=1 Tax=Cicer arietinum TaxID=3827 RepID=A0A1S2XRV7_CICAR|nr:uncharacterized protein LOC101507889 [Cicer arietinum]
MDTNTTVTTISATAPTTDAKVQTVTKKSSDELLRKFAEVGSDEKKELRLIKRRKKRMETQCESPSNGGTTVVERRSLLPPTVSRRSVLLRQLRGRDIRNKSSLLGTIHKTWRRTVEGASRVFMEKHYHRHKRLISDIV